jgi:exportin-T
MKPSIRNFLDELMLPLLSRIFESLDKPIEGTDDAILQTSMRKAYLSFIMSLLNNGMESIFVSNGKSLDRILGLNWLIREVNRSRFDAVLESIIHYATDTSDAAVEKVAFSVLNKMVVVWSSPVSQGTTGGNALDNGFQEVFERFVIEHLSRVCFEVPSKNTFDSHDAQSRLVRPITNSLTIQVLAEIAGLQKSIFQMKGDFLCAYLLNNLFPSIGVASPAAQEYVRALRQLDLKQFKKFFVVLSKS